MPTLTEAEKSRRSIERGVCDLSVIVISYNTRELLPKCFEYLRTAADGLTIEIFVVDNGSNDGSVELVRSVYPEIQLIASKANLGFAAANNRALTKAKGRYFVLLNSDAFIRPDALTLAISHMERNPGAGVGGARLVGPEEEWQPSARSFPSALNDFLTLSGLSTRFSHSRFFGRADRTWADPSTPANVDWVPGAFSIINPKALDIAGLFDEDFFLYYEEVDLCRRIKKAGYEVTYWPDIVVIHLGGESSKKVSAELFSRSGSQLTLWRMRSQLLYYRKHHGHLVLFSYWMELLWHKARKFRNSLWSRPGSNEKASESEAVVSLLRLAWTQTSGGRVSPPRPW
jgi:GT2 family glycosyltransferase